MVIVHSDRKDGDQRVIRGGWWSLCGIPASIIGRAAYRIQRGGKRIILGYRNDETGFRCVWHITGYRNVGTVNVTSSPPGAMVMIDDKPVDLITPGRIELPFSATDPRVKEIKVTAKTADGITSEMKVKVMVNKETPCFFRLSPLLVILPVLRQEICKKIHWMAPIWCGFLKGIS